MSSDRGAVLELQEAADALGVHYQTAYRWVRTGKLPARLVGGRYLVQHGDLAAVDAARRAPAPPPAPGAQRLQRQAERMLVALVEGDETEARHIARRLVDEGAGVTEVISSVLVPPLRAIGDEWQAGHLTIAHEHRASSIVERILGELSPNPRGRRRGTAAVAAVEGDDHSLPTSMAAAALREANWTVHHLGANLPVDDLVRFCGEHRVDLVVISLTNPAASAAAEAAAGQLAAAGTRCVVGGPGRSLDDLIAVDR